MTKEELNAKAFIIRYLNRNEYSKIASLLNDFDFKLTEDPDTTGYVDLNTKQVVLNRNLSMDNAIKSILNPLRRKYFRQALKDPDFIQQMKDENKEIEKLLREKEKNESLNEAKYWNNKQNNEFYNDIRYKVDEAVYQIMKDIFKDLRIDKLASQVHNLVPEYDPSWATHKRDADNNLRLHKVRTGLSASLLDELYDKMNPGSLDRTVNNLRKY
jgi:hypothetical protein